MPCDEAYVVPSQQWPAPWHNDRHAFNADVDGWQLLVQDSRLELLWEDGGGGLGGGAGGGCGGDGGTGGCGGGGGGGVL